MRRVLRVGVRTGALIALALASNSAIALAANPTFSPIKPDVELGKLFDFGVADYNDDGNLDLFTTNHKYLGSILAGDGKGKFKKGLVSARLNQSPGLPGMENLLETPARSSPGLYIYLDKDAFMHIVAIGLDQIPGNPYSELNGSITFLSESFTSKSSRAVELSSQTVGSGAAARTTVSFKTEVEGYAIIKAQHMDLPIEVAVGDGFPASRIFAGADGVHPAARNFEISLRDRHGMAWADYNRDGRTDVFMTSGGLGGGISQFSGQVSDELFLAGPTGTFTESAKSSALYKGPCRGRGAATVDYNRDGQLDLFEVCKGSAPLLQKGLASGAFSVDSQNLDGLDAVGTEYRWIDINGDLSPELVVAGSGSLRVFRRRDGGSWKLKQKVRTRDSGKQTNGLSYADYDSDGDPDLFLIARSGNTLLENRSGRLRAIDPGYLGLPPSKSFAVNWVDYDNDGRTDIHLVPKGVFKQSADGTFKRTKQIRTNRQGKFGIASWADIDNNGSRDPILVAKRGGIFVHALLSDVPKARWIEVNLNGPPGNRDGIGAAVSVKSKKGTQTAWVGQSEGSRYSLGHYRVYFGLGRDRTLRKLTVEWPDGYQSIQRRVGSNQVKTVSHPDGA